MYVYSCSLLAREIPNNDFFFLVMYTSKWLFMDCMQIQTRILQGYSCNLMWLFYKGVHASIHCSCIPKFNFEEYISEYTYLCEFIWEYVLVQGNRDKCNLHLSLGQGTYKGKIAPFPTLDGSGFELLLSGFFLLVSRWISSNLEWFWSFPCYLKSSCTDTYVIMLHFSLKDLS